MSASYVVRYNTQANSGQSFVEEKERKFKSLKAAFIFQRELRCGSPASYRVVGLPVLEREAS